CKHHRQVAEEPVDTTIYLLGLAGSARRSAQVVFPLDLSGLKVPHSSLTLSTSSSPRPLSASRSTLCRWGRR
ncbi:MAG: hypothetical protein ACRDNF_10520, partial [Streptosporangiaceae bacterium]